MDSFTEIAHSGNLIAFGGIQARVILSFNLVKTVRVGHLIAFSSKVHPPDRTNATIPCNSYGLVREASARSGIALMILPATNLTSEDIKDNL